MFSHRAGLSASAGLSCFTTEGKATDIAVCFFPLNSTYSYVDIAWHSPAWDVKQVRGGENTLLSSKCVNITRQMALTAAALLQTSR